MKPGGTSAGMRLMEVRGIVLRFAGLIRTSRIHTTQNRSLSDAINGLAQRLGPLVAELGELVIRIDGSMLRVNGTIVAELKSGAMAELEALAGDFDARGIGGVRFLSPPVADELTAFLGLWRSRPELPASEGAALLNKGLASLQVSAIRMVPPRTDAEPLPTEHLQGHSHAEVLHSYTALVAVGELLADAGTADLPATSRRAEAAVNMAGDVCAAAPELALLAATHRDSANYPAVHAANSTLLSMLLARRLGLGLEGILDVGRAALFCDVGMAMCAPATRQLVGELTEDATVQVLHHPIESFAVALGEERFGPRERAQATVGWEHHCGLDGEGYPGPPPGEQPHLYARIVAICDAYDALLHDRGDRVGLGRPLALEALYQEAGTRFDHVLLHIFFGLLGRFPPGSMVRLREGHSALVLSPAEDARLFDRPFLLVTRAPGGRLLAEPYEMDLSEERGERATRITAVLDDRLFPERVIPAIFSRIEDL